jgi:hypothetical protein
MKLKVWKLPEELLAQVCIQSLKNLESNDGMIAAAKQKHTHSSETKHMQAYPFFNLLFHSVPSPMDETMPPTFRADLLHGAC